MSKDAFWALIQEAKTACGQDLNAMEDYLRAVSYTHLTLPTKA